MIQQEFASPGRALNRLICQRARCGNNGELTRHLLAAEASELLSTML